MDIHALRKLELALCVDIYILQGGCIVQICAQIHDNTTFIFLNFGKDKRDSLIRELEHCFTKLNASSGYLR